MADEDGDIAIFKLSKKRQLIREVQMLNAVYATPTVANDVLFIANKNALHAIAR